MRYLRTINNCRALIQAPHPRSPTECLNRLEWNRSLYTAKTSRDQLGDLCKNKNKCFDHVRLEVAMNRTIFRDVMSCLSKFWRNELHPSSGSKSKLSKHAADRVTYCRPQILKEWNVNANNPSIFASSPCFCTGHFTAVTFLLSPDWPINPLKTEFLLNNI
jgi:hypothetical protein